MSITQHILTKYPFSCIIVIGTWILCFMTIPHSLIYLVLGLSISLEYLRNTKQPSPKFIIVWVWLMPIIMGGLIEVLQSYCTNGNRSGEWLDFFADAIGSTIAVLIGILLV